jgi:hypothetical protein
MPSSKAVIPKHKLFLLMLSDFCVTECILNGTVDMAKIFLGTTRILFFRSQGKQAASVV